MHEFLHPQEFNTFLFDDTIESMLEEAVFQPPNGAKASTSDQLTAAMSLYESAMDTSPDIIPTPPPDTPGQTPKEPTQHYCFSANPNTEATEYIRGSSLEDSPPSSPNNSETSAREDEEDESSDGACLRHVVHSDRESSESSDEDSSAEKCVPTNVKLPQSEFAFTSHWQNDRGFDRHHTVGGLYGHSADTQYMIRH